MRRRRTDGYTLLELMIVVTLVATVSALSLPSLQESRKAANEAAAIGTLRMAVSVSQQYRVRLGAYPVDLTDLYETNLLTDRNIRGYDLTYTGLTDAWNLVAEPEETGVTGDRYFYVDQTGVIRYSTTGTARSTDTPID